MKLFSTFLFLCSLSMSFGQLSLYYKDQSAYNSELNKSAGTIFTGQITYVNYEVSKNRVLNCLTEVVSLTPLTDEKITKKGDYTIITRKFKNKYNDDIVVDHRFVETEFVVFNVGDEQIVESFRIRGLEQYIGEFYGGFWKPNINVIDKNGVVFKHEFMQDLIFVKYKANNKFYKRDVWLEVSNKVIKDTKKFKTELKAEFDRVAKLKKEFDTRRASQVFSVEKTSPEEFKKAVDNVNYYLQNNKNSFDKNLNASFTVTFVVDTLGNQTVSISNESELPARVASSIKQIKMSNYREQGKIMQSKDVYTFKIDNQIKTMEVFEKDFKKIVVLNETEFTADQIEKGKALVVRNKAGKGISKIEFITQDLNGYLNNTESTLSFKSKVGVKKVAVVGLGVVLIGGYVIYQYVL